MILNNIANKSIFSSVGTLIKEEDIEKCIQYVIYNREFISKFPHIIYSFNGNKELVDITEKEVHKIFPNSNVEFLFSENLGHTFGTFLIEYMIYERSKQLVQYDYIWKFSNDTIVTPEIFNVVVEPSDFYYINNIGYNGIINTNVDDLFQSIINKTYFYPQTNYYIIKNGIDFIPNKDKIYELYKYYNDRDDKNLKPWEYIQECACEEFLIKTVNSKNLKCCMLLNESEVKTIVNIVNQYRMWDGSHKNISYSRLGNLCHFHWSEQETLSI